MSVPAQELTSHIVPVGCGVIGATLERTLTEQAARLRRDQPLR